MKLRSQDFLIFTVGLYDPKIIDYEPIRKKNLNLQQLEEIKVFHLTGYCDYNRLSLPHKAMIYGMQKALSRKKIEELTNEEKVLVACYGIETHLMDAKLLQPILDYLKNL